MIYKKKQKIINWLDKHGITNYTINDDCTIDVDRDVNLTYKSLKKIPSFIQFGIVKGNFHCSYNELISLKGSPREVGGCFYCVINKLKSLKGTPKEIRGNFYCSKNNLTTLEGAPEKIGKDFYCCLNKLKSLKGAPETVGGVFVCTVNATRFTDNDVKKVCKVEKNIYVV